MMTRKKKESQASEDIEQQAAAAPTEQQPDDAPMSPEEQAGDLLGRLQRVSADYLNYQKRAGRDLAQARLFANEDLIKSLLPVLDDMERALEAARSNHDSDDALLIGMQLVHDKVLDTLGRFGLQAIEAQDMVFDPQRHTALMQRVSEDHEPNIVIQVVQRGYELKGRAIRPAGVVVSKVPDDEEPSGGAEEFRGDQAAQAGGEGGSENADL